MNCKICDKSTSIYGIVNHLKKAHNITAEEYYDKHIASGKSICIICSNPSEFLNLERGYDVCCSKKCRSVLMVQKIKQTKLEKYGNANYNNIELGKSTKLLKYGSSDYNNRDLAKKTTISRYGVEYFNQLDSEKDRLREHAKQYSYGSEQFRLNMIAHYGSEYYNQTAEGKDKLTIRLQNKEFGFGSNKVTDTIKEKYGVDNISQHPDTKLKVRISHKQLAYYRRSGSLHENFHLLFSVDDYVADYFTYDLQCKTCNSITPFRLYNPNYIRCPKCFPTGNSSIPEKELADFIQSLIPNISILRNTKNVIPHAELDIYMPTKKLAFEFNGLYWHSEVNVDKNYHLRKLELCESAGIHLIHIFQDDWANKKEIIKSRIKNLLIQTSEKIYARKCKIKDISPADKNLFLEKFHLQGRDNSKIRLGAYYNNELVAVMTFGSLRKALGQKIAADKYELLRFCTNSVVVGIASKFLKHFISMYKPKEIISYADRCWTSQKNNVYDTIGFDFVSNTPINYWYIINNKKEHRFGWRKNILQNKLEYFNPNFSEWKNMKLNNYNRIWDCGNLKYRMVF